MSGSDVVRKFRNQLVSDASTARKDLWRKRVIVGGVVASTLAFGTIIVNAQDSSSVYEIAKRYNAARSAVRSAQLPSIFYPSSRGTVTTALSYAPVFHSLMPARADQRADRPRNDRNIAGSPRRIKVAPKQERSDFEESYLSNRTSYCVRTCDGFFFPVGTPDGGNLEAHEAACQRACPGTETDLYVAAAGSLGIDDAVTRKGLRYDALRTAFNYRTQFDNTCSCNGSAQRNYSVMSDFTLRKGDLVMSGEGLKVFTGSDNAQHRLGDFARVDAARLSARERANLQKIEAASLRSNNSSRLSPSLKSRIAAQVNAAQIQNGPGVNKLVSRVARRIQVQDGREMRYVGPDMDFDHAR
ncbi:MAG: DUF2865 domain-containing protein [Proteobacteria bacterium]|nr:DUF2865 domain-containing protein [Pseudomonadota bacterium]